MKTFVLFDTETTGLLLPSTAPPDDQPRIIELGAVRVRNGKIQRELSQLIDPQQEVSDKITKITGILNSDLKGKPTFDDYLPKLRRFFAGVDVLVAHNAPFDVGMIRAEFARTGKEFPLPREVVCTVQEHVHIFGRRPKLTQLYEHFLERPLAQTHRALDDVKALHEVCLKAGLYEQ